MVNKSYLDPKSLQLNELGLSTSHPKHQNQLNFMHHAISYFSVLRQSSKHLNHHPAQMKHRFRSRRSGFIVAADDIESPGVDHINTYNQAIDDYRSAKSSELKNTFLDLAKRTAQLLSDLKTVLSPMTGTNTFARKPTSRPYKFPKASPRLQRCATPWLRRATLPTIPVKVIIRMTSTRTLISNGQVKGNTLLKDIYPGKEVQIQRDSRPLARTLISVLMMESQEKNWISDGTSRHL